MSSVGESSSTSSAGSAPSQESDSGSDSSSSPSESSSPSSSASSQSSSVSSQQAEAAKAEESDEHEARSSDAARDAARAGASVSAQQAAAQDAAEDTASETPDEAAAAARGRAAVASGDVAAATEAAKAGPAARDAVEKEMVARGQFQAVNDLAGDLAATPAEAAALAPDAASGRPRHAPEMARGAFANVFDAVPDVPLPGNQAAERGLIGFNHDITLSSAQGASIGAVGMNVYDVGSRGEVAEVTANVQVNLVGHGRPADIQGPPTAEQAFVEAVTLTAVERGMEVWDGTDLGRTAQGDPLRMDVNVNTSLYQPEATLTVHVHQDPATMPMEGIYGVFSSLSNSVHITAEALHRGGFELDGVRQNVMAHEFGHVLGLSDEYKDGIPRLTEENQPESIMHSGNEVKPVHTYLLGSRAKDISSFGFGNPVGGGDPLDWLYRR